MAIQLDSEDAAPQQVAPTPPLCGDLQAGKVKIWREGSPEGGFEIPLEVIWKVFKVERKPLRKRG